jgi:hypothetical protein
MPVSQADKAARFRAPHEGPGPRGRARGRRGGGGARRRLPVHADRADRELPARQPEPGRHDQAAREAKDEGTFGYLERAVTTAELNDFLFRRS